MPKRGTRAAQVHHPRTAKRCAGCCREEGQGLDTAVFHVKFAYSMQCEDEWRHDCLPVCPVTDFVCVCMCVRDCAFVCCRCFRHVFSKQAAEVTKCLHMGSIVCMMNLTNEPKIEVVLADFSFLAVLLHLVYSSEAVSSGTCGVCTWCTRAYQSQRIVEGWFRHQEICALTRPLESSVLKE